MNLFSVFDSLANGTLVEDMLDGVEKSIDQFEQFVGAGEEKLQSVADVADTAVQKITDGADRASGVIDVVTTKMNK